MKIMLVEDEPLIAMDLETILDRMGHEVVGVAETGDAALSLARALRPDAALVDMKLRDGFTGVNTALQLSNELRMCCALVTGNPEQAAGAGLAVVSKPFTAADIESALKTCC